MKQHPIYRNYMAFKTGKKLFYIPELNKVFWAYDYKNATKKYTGHIVLTKCSLFRTIHFLLRGHPLKNNVGFIVTEQHESEIIDMISNYPTIKAFIKKGNLYIDDFIINKDRVFIDHGTCFQYFDIDKIKLIDNRKIVSIFNIIRFSWYLGFKFIVKNIKKYVKAA